MRVARHGLGGRAGWSGPRGHSGCVLTCAGVRLPGASCGSDPLRSYGQGSARGGDLVLAEPASEVCASALAVRDQRCDHHMSLVSDASFKPTNTAPSTPPAQANN